MPRSVIALGTASFFTDLSSEMIYPLLPVFLAGTLGAGPAALGLIEGIAETVASLMKLASGAWTDRTGRRKGLVLAGYGLSGVTRPLIGIASTWAWVLALRVVDRVGKGLRTTPRDALITDATQPVERAWVGDSVAPELRGRAFGWYHLAIGIGALPGNLVFGEIWRRAGSPAAFGFGTAMAALAALILLTVPARNDAPASE